MKIHTHIVNLIHPFLSAVTLLFVLSSSAIGAIEKQHFDQIIDLARHLYAPEFESRQQRLVIMDYWEIDRLEASARNDMDSGGRLAVITVTGGLARHHTITEGAFALVICHEIGHFLAGPPAIGRFSTEGQSDYFAASACMRKLIPHMPKESSSDIQNSSDYIRKQCGVRFSSERESDICVKTAMAGLALSHYFAHKKAHDFPRFETPDPTQVEVLRFGTKTAQCRLDTYVAAAMCNPQVEDATFMDRRWLCSRSGELAYASRPHCWYPDSS